MNLYFNAPFFIDGTQQGQENAPKKRISNNLDKNTLRQIPDYCPSRRFILKTSKVKHLFHNILKITAKICKLEFKNAIQNFTIR